MKWEKPQAPPVAQVPWEKQPEALRIAQAFVEEIKRPGQATTTVVGVRMTSLGADPTMDILVENPAGTQFVVGTFGKTAAEVGRVLGVWP